MCDTLAPIDELKNLRFSISSLADLHDRGSYHRELAANAARGIRARLDWCIANLDRAGEGQKNFGLEAYPQEKKP